MKKFRVLILISFTLVAASKKPDFARFNCAVIKPGQSINTQPQGKKNVVFDGSNDLVYWVRIQALPFKTGNPQLDAFLNQQPRNLDYVGCDSYENFWKDLRAGNCVFCKEHFWDLEIKTGDVVWFLVVGNSDTDFCYITSGGPLDIRTKIIAHQNDAGSGRDASLKRPVFVTVNRTYRGSGANDHDLFVARLPRGKLIKFSITYLLGPRGKRKLLYAFVRDRDLNSPVSCTRTHQLISYQLGGGGVAEKRVFYPGVGETAYCFLKYKKVHPQDDFINILLWVKPPLQYPPPDVEGKPREEYKLPVYQFSFQVVEK